VQLNCNYKGNKKLALKVHCVTDDTSLREITFVMSWHTRVGHSPLHHAKALMCIPHYFQICISITFPMYRKCVTKKKKVNVYLSSLMMKLPYHVYALDHSYTCYTYSCYAYNFYAHRLYFTNV
jgi:hypothetical protein